MSFSAREFRIKGDILVGKTILARMGALDLWVDFFRLNVWFVEVKINANLYILYIHCSERFWSWMDLYHIVKSCASEYIQIVHE